MVDARQMGHPARGPADALRGLLRHRAGRQRPAGDRQDPAGPRFVPHRFRHARAGRRYAEQPDRLADLLGRTGRPGRRAADRLHGRADGRIRGGRADDRPVGGRPRLAVDPGAPGVAGRRAGLLAGHRPGGRGDHRIDRHPRDLRCVPRRDRAGRFAPLARAHPPDRPPVRRGRAGADLRGGNRAGGEFHRQVRRGPGAAGAGRGHRGEGDRVRLGRAPAAYAGRRPGPSAGR